MTRQTRSALIAAASTIGLAAGSAAGADFEKPPGVPPEVETAKVACPTLTGPVYGYYQTRWRVLPAPIEVMPIEVLPTIPKSAAGGNPNDGAKDKSGPKRSKSLQPAAPVSHERHDASAAIPKRPIIVEVMPTPMPAKAPSPVQTAETAITIDGKAIKPVKAEPNYSIDLPPIPPIPTKRGSQ